MLIPVELTENDGPRRDGRQVHLSVAQIHTVMQPPGRNKPARINDLQENDWSADWQTVRNVLNPVIGVLPAEKGTLLLLATSFGTDEKYEIAARYPVLGWTIRNNGLIQPAIASGLEVLGNEPWVILHPNKSVEMTDGGFYENEKIWLEYLNGGGERAK